ncbi:MAG: ornithine cyclodeaminase family protein [Nitrososphaerales archaeon]
MPLLLTYQHIESVLNMNECIEVLEELFKAPQANIWNPLRSVLQLPEDKTVWLFMPAYVPSLNTLAIKIVSEHAYNPVRYNLPKQAGEVILHNPVNGQLLAIMDATIITMLRTGALCGVAAKYLARKDSSNVGLLGSGLQARSQLQAVCTVRKVKKVKVYSPTRQHREEFAKRMSNELLIDVKAVDSAQEAVKDVDMVITATNSSIPVIFGEWLDKGVHINSIGTLPDRRELDLSIIKKANVIVVDKKESVFNEAGDIINALKQGVIASSGVLELEEVVSGRKQGRKNEEDITLFKCVGFALLDLVTAVKAYEYALQKGVGLQIPSLLNIKFIG